MKTLYLECQMGAAGDMIMGALLELIPDPETFMKKINGLNLLGAHILQSSSTKCGIKGTHITVSINGIEEGDSQPIHELHHVHRGLDEITEIIDALDLEESIKMDIKKIYEIIAFAESRVHGINVSDIHFHEVGTVDAIADITGCVMLFHEIQAKQIVVSPITTGYGQVRCAHGILPVPAPATALILSGIPCRSGNIEGELCTPTGAAVLKYFATSYSYMPEMMIEKIGYGMGKKDFPASNCVRAILGDAL